MSSKSVKIRTEINSRICGFLKHIDTQLQEDSLASLALRYESSINTRHTMTSYISQLEDTLLQDEYIKKPFLSHSKHTLKHALKQHYSDIWKNKLELTSKANTFKTHKTNLTYENYLTLIPNRHFRRTLAKIRLSDHCLSIETGRHTKPPTDPDKRLCKFCQDEVENEVHFVLKCKSFAIERNAFLSKINDLYRNWSNIPSYEQKYIFLMTNEDPEFLLLFSNFIHTIYTTRFESENRTLKTNLKRY